VARVLTVRHMNRCIACYGCMLACARSVYGQFSLVKSAIQIRTRGGLQSKLAADVCLGCVEPACALACPQQALQPRPGGGVRMVRSRCDGCAACAEACIARVIRMDPEEERPIVCIQCGQCVRYCPHAVLEMVPVDEGGV
jgi:Fe-S-cluster-containing dehydrogenase component